jgi:hypothetical protein
MHKVVRYAIYSFKTLSVIVETVEAIQRHIVHFTSKSKQKSRNKLDAMSKVRTYIAF